MWGYERFPTTRTVDTDILRPAWILTLHGHGYKFAAV